MKRARKLWTAFLMTAVMTMSMGIPTVFADDVVGMETTVETTETENNAENVENQNNDEGIIANNATNGDVIYNDDETPASTDGDNADETPASTDGDVADATPASVDDEDDGEPVAIPLETGDETYSFSGGTGEENTPYEIATEADLIGLATMVNAGETVYNTAYYKLTADIKLESNFTPIGTSEHPFKGTFDGSYTYNGSKTYIISAADDVVIGDSGSNYQGLFGYIDGASISGVTVSADVVGNNYVGGVVGYATGTTTTTISDCHNQGNITGSGSNVGGLVGSAEGTTTITDCNKTDPSSGGTVTVTGASNVGGLVGSATGTTTITNCKSASISAGAVMVTGASNVGGLVGSAYATGTTIITDCYNTSTGTVTGESNVGGLVGYATGTTTITDCYNTSTGTVTGASNVGGLVGSATGTITISTCYNTGEVTGTGTCVGGIVGQIENDSAVTITSCYNTNKITGFAVVGGIVGQIGTGDTSDFSNPTGSTVQYCYNTGHITGENECVGGLVGTSNGTVQYCYNTGMVVGEGASLGGLVGNSNGPVQYSYNVGVVTYSGGTPASTHGGVIGGGEYSAITSCYYNSEIFVATSHSNTEGTALTTKEMTGDSYVQADNRAGYNMAGLNTGETTFTFTADGSSGTIGYYPVLSSNTQTPAPSAIIGLTSVDGVYQITNEADLKALATLVNGGNDCAGMTFVLTSNIELKNDFTSIGAGSNLFGGTFDGDFKTISTTGDYIIGSRETSGAAGNYQGLFGSISSTATVQNVTVSATVSGYRYVGGVVGSNDGGTVENCHNTGTVIGGDAYVGGVVGSNDGGTVENCSNSGTVTGDGNYVGGVVGYNSASNTATATVRDCSNSGDVTGGNNYVGGVVGNNYANATNESAIVTNCSNSGDVTGTSNYVGGVVGQNYANGNNVEYAPEVIVSHCSNTGNVTGSGVNIGGVVGSNFASRGTATVSNCSNTGDVTCYENTGDDTDNSNVGGVVGYNNGVIGGTATVADCSNTGDVTGAENNVGGVVGYNIGGMDIDNSDRSGTAIVTGCSNYGDVTGDVNNVGGIVGNNFVDISGGEAIATNSKNYGEITGVDYVGGVVGLNNEDGEVTKCGSVNAVTGTGENVDVFIGGGDGTDENCYVITFGSSYYIKAKAIGNGTVAPEDEDASPDSMYKVTKLSDVTFEFTPDDGYEVTDVIVNDVSVGVCDEYEFEDIIFTMQTLEVVFEKSSTSSDEEEDEEEDEESEEDVVEKIELPFGDVDEDDDNYEGIAYVYENGLMAGISSDVFGGDMSITRGMIAAILFRIDGSVPVNAIMPFADIPADQYYYEAVNWGKAEGVMAGISATEFDPDAPITNEQFITFLYRYATYLGMDMTIEWSADLTGYEMSDYAIITIAWALENGIIDEDCVPITTALRGDVATSLMNFMEM